MRRIPPRGVAVVLVAHGSRRSEGRGELRRYAQALQRSGLTRRVVIAFLELASPRLPEALGRLAAQGWGTILISSFFLLEGRHTRRDLPRLVRQAKRDHPGTRIRLAGPLGFDGRLARVLVDRLRKAR